MPNRFLSALLSGAAVAVTAAPALAQSTEDPALLDVIIVTGSRAETATELNVTPEAAPFEGGDITYLASRTPGGSRIANGEVSGQMQYRGLFGERLNLRVDGQRFASGGPNLMDPVFHYAPAPLVASVAIDRGVSPVSAGPGLAGGADAVFKRVDYVESSDLKLGYDLTLGGRSINESVSTGGVIGAANDQFRFNALGAWEEGDDTEYADGVIAGTAFERGVYGISAGARTGFGEWSLDLRRQNTGPSGNPPFPMDIQYFDTDFARLGYAHDFGGVRFTASAHYTDVAHKMDNFSQRPAPMPMRWRATLADATTRGAEASIAFAALGGELEIGIGGEKIDHHARITNPNNANFFVTPFPDVEFERFGGFAEWTGDVGFFHSQLGVRLDNHSFDAGEAVLGPMLPMMPRMLAGAFNTADRSGEETTFDAVARLWTPEKNGVSWRVTLARKQQMPGYIQRYGWLPINASGGLADGNIYVGDIGIDPETAWLAEAGFDFASSEAYFRPTVFLRQVDDYIQGVPFDDTVGVIDSPVEMVAMMNGDATPLRWDNVDARLYGFDLDGGYDFEGPLRVDGVLNFVRGERREINDNLYRVAPPNLSVGLTWESDSWSTTFETRAVAEQENVSLTNSEAETKGYVVLSAYGDWEIGEGVRLSAGVENLLDHVYKDHLAGYNRNGFGDLPVGERVPGAGRGVFIRLSISR